MEIGQIDKNSLNKIIVQIAEYNGFIYADIRVHYLAEDGEYKRTKKSVTLTLKNIDMAIKLLTKARKNLKKHG